ncbi:uncharacterized protein LOC135489083 [Lineus longissimus]|uniref:uncharacterized protein LOC135489083 n=1 Tax=Lineus longissimus TaxID=88925 RepID=UPI002B4DFC20
MYHFELLAVTFTCLVLSGTEVSGASLAAEFKLNGINGFVVLTETSATMNLTLTTGTIASGSYSLKVHELPVRLDVKNPCDPANLGQEVSTVITAATNTDLSSDSAVSLTTSVALSGTNSVAGKALLIQHATIPATRYCATIGNSRNMKTAHAMFQHTVGGEVIFRQDVSGGDVTVYVNLFDLVSQYSGVTASWMTASGKVDEDVTMRCAGATGVGGKLGDVNIGSTSGTARATATLTSVTLSSFIGKLIILKSSAGAVIACAEVRELMPKSVESVFSSLELRGKVTFFQKSCFDPTMLVLNFGNVASATSWGIAQFPVRQRLTASENVCSSAGATYDPFTQGSSAVGKLDQRFGSLASLVVGGNNKVLYDMNLPLFGRHSVIGRSMTVTVGAAVACANIGYPNGVGVNVGIATFTYPVIGRIVLRQISSNPQSETSIFVEMKYPDGSTATTNHNWHVHESNIKADFMASTGTCAKTGGHFNPFGANTKAAQYSNCNAANPLQCELGDSSNKHETINIGSGSDFARYFFTDIDLPLSGVNSVLGRSFVIHKENAAAGRYACANIYHQREYKASTGKWSDKPVTGMVIFKQKSAFDPAEVTVNLDNLQSEAGGFHVHLYPVPEGAASPCSAGSVSGHFNPFSKTTWPPATQGTDDQYEVGDLSNKYGMLTGLTSKSAAYTDTNLDLSGQQSIVGRSLVIHKLAGNSRWVCANISYSNADGRYFRAMAKFDNGEVAGYIRLSQMVWPDGSHTDTAIEVDLYYKDNATKVTNQHNWHVHEHPVWGDDNSITGRCSSTGPHYNPFKADTTAASYKTQCSFTNPLACEVGDTSGKTARYDIGGGKKFFTDVYTPLAGNFSVMGRSVVVHVANAGAARFVCADLLPETTDTYMMTFPKSTSHNKNTLVVILSNALKTDSWNLATEFMSSKDDSCQSAMVYFTGFESAELRKTLIDLVIDQNSVLGTYTPTKECGKVPPNSGLKLVVSPSLFLTLIISFIITSRN